MSMTGLLRSCAPEVQNIHDAMRVMFWLSNHLSALFEFYSSQNSVDVIGFAYMHAEICS